METIMQIYSHLSRLQLFLIKRNYVLKSSAEINFLKKKKKLKYMPQEKKNGGTGVVVKIM